MGLINCVVPYEKLEETTVQWAKEILQLSPIAIRCLKSALNADCDGEPLWLLTGYTTMEPDLMRLPEVQAEGAGITITATPWVSALLPMMTLAAAAYDADLFDCPCGHATVKVKARFLLEDNDIVAQGTVREAAWCPACGQVDVNTDAWEILW